MRHMVSLALVALLAWCARGAAVSLQCLIVGGSEKGVVTYPRTEEEVRGIVAGVNRIFAQAAISFQAVSISTTNCNGFTRVDVNDNTRLGGLCSLMRNAGRLELYFVQSLEDAAGVYTPEGIVISGEANFWTVAHEIGHAFGWPDIYVERDSTFRTVEGAPSASCLPLDNGFFPAGTMQPDLVRRLLMYGIASDTKGRISRGDVYGLQVLPAEVPGGARVLRFGLVPVGMSGVTNFSPRSL